MSEVYYNGNIITMEEEDAEAIIVENGIIKEVGSYKKIISQEPNAIKVDLKGHTLMPAFIDSHSHFSGLATSMLQIHLDEEISIEKIQEKIRMYIDTNKLQKDKWVLATGYDDNNFEIKKHPTREDLDKISMTHPIMIQHKSGHVGVFNTRALEILGVTNDTKEIEGGLIEKKYGNITGYMEESAFTYYIKKIPIPEKEELLKSYLKAQEKYLSYGITTIQEGMLVKQMIPLYDFLISSNLLNLDLVAYMEVKSADELEKYFKNSIMKYEKHFKIGGYKIFLDGSPQARTAWMKTPYIGDKNYKGYGTMNYKDVYSSIKKATENNMQILAHCNGDAAAQQYIDTIKKLESEGIAVNNLRPVMIHAQFLELNQLKDVKKEGILPSFFVSHVYHWGDVHIKNFGLERASKISPVLSTLKNNISFTFHQDSPVLEPNMIEAISCAVNRITKSGITLGDDEKISVKEALKAVTINAAYQYFEEDKKGSIKKGKNADLVILDKNPLEVAAKELKNIKVLETIKDGKSLYRMEKGNM